ncbi:MAG: HD-GYP domain-containing protein [Acidimicrobiia bacterium]|nr:HD-GYP domain-containing protein [Acidimicrobiia bacterium]
MSEKAARALLGQLRGATKQLTLYPIDHPATGEVLAKLRQNADALSKDSVGEVVLSILGDSLYENRSLLAHASLEFNKLLRDLQSRGIESISFEYPVSEGDVYDLVAFAAGLSGDIPAGGTIRLNEGPFTRAELESDEAISGLRRSYARSLDVLRGVALALEVDEGFDLTGATWAVEQLVEQTLAQPSASLLLSTMKSHDEYTFYHSVNVCILSIALARLAGLPEDELKLLAVGALLHDIGKVRVQASTLQYPGRLNPEQWAEIKLHPQEGAAAILAAAAPGQEIAAVVAFEHHARFDGQGYPSLVYDRERHFFSRLVATADTYDALTTRRSYRRAETPNRALQVLLQGAGTFYDPSLVHAFIKMVGVYPTGSLLQLAGGELVMVTRNNDEASDYPDVVLVRTGTGESLEVPEPFSMHGRSIVDQVTPAGAGIDPAALLEVSGYRSA